MRPLLLGRDAEQALEEVEIREDRGEVLTVALAPRFGDRLPVQEDLSTLG
jgi:hypothetical protein